MTLLSVNVNKVAVLRNSRGGREPDPAALAKVAVSAGCGGITVHPRPDQRHIRADDVPRIAAILPADIEFNIEGNPFAPARGSYPGLLALVQATRPAQVTLVPDGDGQITSDHGFDLHSDGARLRPLIVELKQTGARVSLFVDAGNDAIERVADIGADRVELYTGPFADAGARGDGGRELEACVGSAARARAAGLGVNAGHDLSQRNLAALLEAIPWIAEVSIGHALFAEALLDGLATTVRRYVSIIAMAPKPR